MRLKRVVAAVLFALSAPTVFGGVSYHFDAVGTGIPGEHRSGTIVIDGSRARADYTIERKEVKVVHQSAVVTDRGRHFRLFTQTDESKTYYVATPQDLDEMPVVFFPRVSAPRHVENAQVSVRTPDERRTIQGFRARHVLAEVSYEFVLGSGKQKVSLPLKTTWDLWLTDDVPASLQPDGRLMLSVGAVEVDSVVNAHPELGGFVLEATGTIMSRFSKAPSTFTYAVTGVNTHATFPADFFDGPPGFHKVLSPQERADAINEHVREMEKGH